MEHLTLDDSTDVWVDIFMGYYQVSPDGRVRRSRGARGTREGKELKAYTPRGSRYSYVKLHGDGQVVQVPVEVLVDSLFQRVPQSRSHAA